MEPEFLKFLPFSMKAGCQDDLAFSFLCLGTVSGKLFIGVCYQLARIVGNNEISWMRREPGSRELAKELWEPLRHAMVMTPQMTLIVFPLNPESRQA